MSIEYIGEVTQILEDTCQFTAEQCEQINNPLIQWEFGKNEFGEADYVTLCGRFNLRARKVKLLTDSKAGCDPISVDFIEFSAELDLVEDPRSNRYIYQPEDLVAMARILKIINDEEFWPIRFSDIDRFVSKIPAHIENILSKLKYLMPQDSI